MKFFLRAATATLTGLVMVGAASAAFAHHIPQQPFVPSETKMLLDTAREVGVGIFSDKTDPDLCGGPVMGMANDRHQLLICTENHHGDVDELADTIRHELVHTAQFCKGKRTGGKAVLLYPDLADKALLGAEMLHMPFDSYAPSQRAIEAEARVLAQIYEEEQIAAVLRRECVK